MEYHKHLHLIYTNTPTERGYGVINVSIYPNKKIMFKKLSLATCLFVISVAAKADDGQKVDSKVQKVTVFLNGAQVTRSALANIPAGTSTLIFSNLSPNINPQSMQVHADGNFTILSVKSEIDYSHRLTKPKGLEELQLQQKTVQDKLALQNTILTIDQQEEQTLLKNQFATPQNATLDIEKLKLALDFQTLRLTEIKKREAADNEHIAACNAELQKIQSQITETYNNNNAVTGNILVMVSAKAALQSMFNFSYVVSGASWYASYDVRAKNTTSPITITYKANVTQQTGEEWKNIKLNLSTGNPSVGGIKPELNPYYLNFFTYKQEDKSKYELAEVAIVNSPQKARLNGKDFAGGDLAKATRNLPADILQQIQVIENQTNFEFSIDNPFSIAGDGKAYTVEINQVEMPAQYQYYAAPKIRTDVFLTAQLTDWNKYNFLPGEANVFFEGTYVGKSVINTSIALDTLNLSLGTDKSIVVTRTSQKDLTEKPSLSSNKKETRNWLIDVKNRKNQPINLLVEDQIPVSQNSAIEVDAQDISGGILNKETGKIAWNLKLNPADEKKLQLKYQVKYPKNQNIIVQ